MELLHLLLCLMYIFSSAVSELHRHYVSEFKIALKSHIFVDRTLLLKDFITKQKRVVYITAPSHSGKTTILDMITAFFDMDDNFAREPLESTSNYRLFCSPGKELKICKEKAFIERYMGQHPVVRINYKTLESFESYEDVLAIMKPIYLDTYLKYEGLLMNRTFDRRYKRINEIYELLQQNTSIWGKQNITVRETTIKYAIRKFLQALNDWTGKDAIVLIDEYDSFGKQLLTNPKDDKLAKEIISLMEEINTLIFKVTPIRIRKSLITGVLTARDMGLSPVNVEEIKFYENKDIASYYRLNEKEVGSLVENVSHDYDAVMKYIKENYDGYRVSGLNNVTFYSSPNVIEYLTSIYQNDVPHPKTTYERLTENIKYSESFAKDINELLLNQALPFPGFMPLSYAVLERTKRTDLSLPTNSSEFEEHERFFIDMRPYLYSYYVDIGYLTLTDQFKLQIPNKHMEKEFTKIMNGYYINRFISYRLDTKKEEQRLVDVFLRLTVQRIKKSYFQEIYDILKIYYEKTKNVVGSEAEFKCVLYHLFLDKSHSFGGELRIELPTRETDKNETDEGGRIDIYIRNYHGVVILIQAKYIKHKKQLKKKTLEKSTNDGIKQIYQKYHDYIFNGMSDNPYRRRVKKTTSVLYIAILYIKYSNTSSIQTVFSNLYPRDFASHITEFK